MRRVLYGILMLIALCAGLVVLNPAARRARPITTTNDQTHKKLSTGLTLRDFMAKKNVPLDSFRGKVLLINFWASWCEACTAEIPSIQNLYATLHDKGLEVLTVNVDEDPERIVPMMRRKLGFTFPVYSDPDGGLSKEFDVVAIPFNVIVDRSQNVVWSESGERDWSSSRVLSEIETLVKGGNK